MSAAYWTAERVAELRSLHAAMCSATQIALRMGGVTRNAVIGKLHRLGIKAIRPPGHDRVELPPRHADGRFKPPPPAIPPRPKQRQWWPVPPQGLPLLELDNFMCRYALTEEGPHLFCARPADLAANRPWCEEHERVVYGGRR